MVAAALAGSPLLAEEKEAGGDPKAATLDELLSQKVSSAAKYEQTVREAAASVTIVTAQEIETFGFATLAELLSSVRSFYVSYDRNYDYVGTRGLQPSDRLQRPDPSSRGRAHDQREHVRHGADRDRFRAPALLRRTRRDRARPRLGALRNVRDAGRRQRHHEIGTHDRRSARVGSSRQLRPQGRAEATAGRKITSGLAT